MNEAFDDATVTAQLRAAGCVFAEEEAQLLTAAFSGQELRDRSARRVAGEPLELVLGWAEFAGLRIQIAPGVFIPRRRSELLFRVALNALAACGKPRPVVVELCCGAAAIATALASTQRDRVPGVEFYASDIDPAAVDCARLNLGAAATVVQGDVFDGLPHSLRGSIDVLIANAPYVPTSEIEHLPREARLYEPSSALDGGLDGLEVARRIIVEAPSWLAPGGSLHIETSRHQVAAGLAALAAAGLQASSHCDDELRACVITGRRERA